MIPDPPADPPPPPYSDSNIDDKLHLAIALSIHATPHHPSPSPSPSALPPSSSRPIRRPLPTPPSLPPAAHRAQQDVGFQPFPQHSEPILVAHRIQHRIFDGDPILQPKVPNYRIRSPSQTSLVSQHASFPVDPYPLPILSLSSHPSPWSSDDRFRPFSPENDDPPATILVNRPSPAVAPFLVATSNYSGSYESLPSAYPSGTLPSTSRDSESQPSLVINAAKLYNSSVASVVAPAVLSNTGSQVMPQSRRTNMDMSLAARPLTPRPTGMNGENARLVVYQSPYDPALYNSTLSNHQSDTWNPEG